MLLLILAVASGIASLVYQIVWMRRLVLVFGSATLATSTVLAVFLGGLAVGAWVWGRVADRHPGRALPLYGFVEAAIGLYALASPWAFRGMERLYLALYPGLESSPGWYAVVQFMLSALVILPPAALMGGTVPLLARRVTVGADHVQGVGALYGWNTLGAAAGAALATYALLPGWGLTTSITIGAALNALCAVAAFALGAVGRTAERRVAADPSSSLDVDTRPGPSRLLLVGFGLSGVAAMAYELVWTRLLGLVMGSSVYAFGTLVVVLLAGLGLGSAIYARLRLAPAGHRLAFGIVQSLIGLGGVASLLIAPHLPFVLMSVFPVVRGGFGWQIAAQFLVAAFIAFLPSLLMGAAFPAAVGSLGRPAASVGRSIGTAYVANTVGTVVGAFVAGFLLIPGLGLRETLIVGVAANLIAGLCVLGNVVRSRRRWPLLAPALVTLGVILTLPSWPREVFAIGTGFFAPMFATREGLARGVAALRLVYYRDGLNTTISVDEVGGHLVYRSNGKTDASTYPIDMANQVLLGQVPMLLHGDPRDVFVLGLGTGVTAAAVARHPVARIDIAELEPAAIAAARLFERANRGVLDDPRVRVLVGDGRNRLLATPTRYDVVISDASDIWIAGVGSLFTREFYQIAADRLKPGGLMVQWLHTNCLAPPEFRLLVATFRAVFPRVAIWSSGIGDIFLVGSREPVPWVYDRLVQRIEGTANVRHDLQSIGIWHPAALFAAFVVDDEGVERLVGPAPRLHTDDVPTLEFVTPRSLYVDTNAQIEEIFRHVRGAPFPPITGFDPERLDGVATYLLGFAYASQGRTPLGVTYMERSVRMAPDRAPLWVGLGHRYRELGRPRTAEAAFQRAVAVDPADVQARLALAAFLLDDGQASRALEVAQAALHREPDNAGVKDLVARARAATPR